MSPLWGAWCHQLVPRLYKKHNEMQTLTEDWQVGWHKRIFWGKEGEVKGGPGDEAKW